MATIEAAKYNNNTDAVTVDWQDRYNTVLATLDEECRSLQVLLNDTVYYESGMKWELKDHFDMINSKFQVIREMIYDAGK